jgi:hypothetical protein
MGILDLLEEMRLERGVDEEVWIRHRHVFNSNGREVDLRHTLLPLDFPLHVQINLPGLAAHASNPEDVHVILIEHHRDPWEYEQTLASEPLLQECLDHLRRAGHNVVFGTDEPKMYVEPELLGPTIRKLRWKGAMLKGTRVLWHHLKARHVIVSPTYYDAVQSAVAQLKKSLYVKVRDETVIDLTSDDDVPEFAAAEKARANMRDRLHVTHGDDTFEVQVFRTTIQVDTPSSLFSGTSAGYKTCSTPGGHAPNKRSRHQYARYECGAFRAYSSQQNPSQMDSFAPSSQSLGGYTEFSESTVRPSQQGPEETQSQIAPKGGRLYPDRSSSSQSIGSLGLSGLDLN